ncbi:Sucrase/ferredoxin-like family protein [Thalictrum thalictroides]|uniref:Sucrase/ferredoxin-like family protein n=1 Tax=Thalictrum thalictroides TaxID=46969 RepID=A0A7J6UTU3_THATH|nr:Sucrase/ferredoxin-like family protein [Thalictrum thalictroides]
MATENDELLDLTTTDESINNINTVFDPSPPPTTSFDSTKIVDVNITSNGGDDEDLKFGFKRPEMYKEKFPKAVDRYDRHVFLCYKTALSWPNRVEDVNSEPLPGQFALSLKSRKDDIQRKTRFTVIEGKSEAGYSDGDVLIFPEMIKYKNLTHETVNGFVEDVLVKGTNWTVGSSPEKLTGFHVFVCAHANRDKRCGVCGPVLVEKLKEEIELRGLKDQILVSPCSHIGGHKYAGNVIVFGPNSEEKVMGHWYGYVTPEDIPLLLDQHIGKGQVIEHLWRGEVCVSCEEKKEESGLKPQESDAAPYLNGTNLEKNVDDIQGTVSKDNMQNGGCCQGTNGFSCCRDDKVDLDSNVAENQPRKGSNVCARGVGKVSAWIGKLEQPEVLTAVAVVGAVATVAVAYSIYRRSG